MAFGTSSSRSQGRDVEGCQSQQLGFWDSHCCGGPVQRASSPLYLVHQYKSSQLDEVECVPLTLCGPRGGAIESLDTYPCVCSYEIQ